VQHYSGGQLDQSAVDWNFATDVVGCWWVGIVTVDVGLLKALAGWEPRPANSDLTEQGYDKLLQAESHIVVVGFVGADGRKVEVVAECRLVAWVEAEGRDIAEEARRSHDLVHMVLEQAQAQPYAPSA
jgi:hypothetical protein